MLSQFKFYFLHSINDLRVNKRLTFFALLAVSAGVAAIVSLQTLAVMIDDTLEGNLQETNRGDVSAVISDWQGGNIAIGVRDGLLVENTVSFFGEENTEVYLTEKGLEHIQSWLAEEYPGSKVTHRISLSGMLGTIMGFGKGTAVTADATGEQVTSTSPILINPDIYPFYGETITEEGANLSTLLESPTDIVVSHNIARDLDLEIGDAVRLNGSDSVFVLRGIVATEVEVKGFTNGFDFFSGLFGFYYLNTDAKNLFEDYTPQIQMVYFQLKNPEDVIGFEERFTNRYNYFDTVTTEDLREINEQIVLVLADVVTVMGLVSLLIGSIGIINTMNVIVRRRTLEIAVLKTIGLQANQVTILFICEAFIIGIIGSLSGIVLGWVMTFVIRGVAETLFATELPFRMAFDPAFNGFFVGVLVTTVFGFLPTLAAGQVRPGIVLRPMDNIVPRAGKIRTLFALILTVIALSFIAHTVLGNLPLSFGVVLATFFAAAILFVILWVLIWIIGKLFPTMGIVDLKVALRQMVAGRSRGASTLLALSIGMFSLSIITLFVESALDLFEDILQENGNMVISMPAASTSDKVVGLLDSMDGINYYTVMMTYSAELVSFHDTDTETSYTPAEIRQLIRDTDIDLNNVEHFDEEYDGNMLDYQLLDTQIEGQSLDYIRDVDMAAGRYLSSDDMGKPVIVLEENVMFDALGLGVGDELVYRVGGEEIAFEIIGLQSTSEIVMQFSDAAIFAPMGAFPESTNPNMVMILADVEEESIVELRRELGGIPGTFALEMTVFTKMINAMINTFTAFPSMLAALGLVVGGVVIANSVALSTMERRKEIAVMKAVGLQRERVLGMLLLENGLLGFVGGVFGIGISIIALVAMNRFGDMPSSPISVVTILWLMSLCVGVALIAALSSAWAASGEKPLNVLRYE